MIWKIVAPMLDRNVRERITLFRSDYQDALRELVDIENIPPAYGGTCQCGDCRNNSPQELEIFRFAKGEAASQKMASTTAGGSRESQSESSSSSSSTSPGGGGGEMGLRTRRVTFNEDHL
uniref:CRAL-TRIO domain-containing protein n=1 Tax=Octactis speculum TaxID=3111310 RepID=A0A7S2B9A3_9STRA